MTRSVILVASGTLAILMLTSFANSQDSMRAGANPTEMGEFNVYPPDAIEWQKGPASLPAGAQMAVLDGDPSKSGPFVFRLKVPDGYTIAPHIHPKAERLTVIAGTFNIAMGEKVDKTKGKTMPTGSFGYWPAGMEHFAWVTGETIVQFHGEGPWLIHYLNPEDDPRKTKTP